MFNLYFAGWGCKEADIYLRQKTCLRLLSYVNEYKLISSWLNDNLGERLFIDSGAYSVAHSNKQVDLDKYIEFISNNQSVRTFVELDVIPYPLLNIETAKYCSEKSWENYIYMMSKLDTKSYILPVYHFGEPKDSLRRILNTEINGKLPEYICIGGRQGVSTDLQIAYFNEIFYIIQKSKNPKVKVHALGITIPRILEFFPFYSADSTTWVQSAINGSILRHDLTMIKISDNTKYMLDNVQSMPNEVKNLISSEVGKLNYDFNDLCADYKLRLQYNIDILYNWAKNYKYKGPEQFVSKRLF